MPEPIHFAPMPSPEQTARAVAESVQIRPPRKAEHNHVSMLGDICQRRLVYRRTIGHKAEPPSVGLGGIFKTGDMLTPFFVDQIFNPFGRRQRPSWSIQEQEGTAIDPDDALFVKFNLSGRLDGVRHVTDTTGRPRRFNVAEFKTMNSNLFQIIRTLDDLGRTHWTAKYSDQVLLYMIAAGLIDNPGWLVLINKTNWYECRIIEVPYEPDRIDVLFARAREIEIHVREKTLPHQINRPDICESCNFLGACAPTLVGDPDAMPTILPRDHDDFAELHKLLSDHLLLDEPRREAEQVRKKLKGRLVPGKNLVVGGLMVTWKVHGKGWRMIVSDESEMS